MPVMYLSRYRVKLQKTKQILFAAQRTHIQLGCHWRCVAGLLRRLRATRAQVRSAPPHGAWAAAQLSLLMRISMDGTCREKLKFIDGI